MTPTLLPLAEPLVQAMKKTLETRVPAAIEEINTGITDNVTIDPIAQYLPYMPFAQALQGGLPILAVQRLGGVFEDDLQTVTHANHEYAVIAVVENADHETLALQLERTLQAAANAIQKDRVAELHGETSIMRTEGGAWSVNFQRVEPGPLLGDLDPEAPNTPPRSYLSWLGLVMSSKREEI